MAGTIKRLRGIVFFGLLFSLVLTSHFSVLELVMECPHHHAEAGHADEHEETTAANEGCTGFHQCHHSTITYLFPAAPLEPTAPDMTLPASRPALHPPAPFLGTPFQPPRSA